MYESFPFSLNEAIAYNVPLLSSNYKNIKNIFGDSISYFSPISESDTEKELLSFIENKPKADYSKVLEEYSKEHTASKFLDLILKY
jgi:glycosyltransferase involved in cell wall biosynthesis